MPEGEGEISGEFICEENGEGLLKEENEEGAREGVEVNDGSG